VLAQRAKAGTKAAARLDGVLPTGGPGRDLRPEELAALARAIAAEPALWRPLVEHDPDERRHESLFSDEHLGLWVISWMPGHDTGFHDHDGACGAVAVAEGTVREERPFRGSAPRRIDPSTGESFCFDATELHRMIDVSDEPAVTIHAYSPPIDRMGLYSVDDDGYVTRQSIPWDQTLDADDA
jgi:predicted metal-dependent enzyme (double-stranded beta helix superfamily)